MIKKIKKIKVCKKISDLDEKQNIIKKALLQKARGLTIEETLEEFSLENNQMVLTKKKISTKEVPPDINAIKALIEIDGITNVFCNMTNEELEEERKKLLLLLKEESENENKSF